MKIADEVKYITEQVMADPYGFYEETEERGFSVYYNKRSESVFLYQAGYLLARVQLKDMLNVTTFGKHLLTRGIEYVYVPGALKLRAINFFLQLVGLNMQIEQRGTQVVNYNQETNQIEDVRVLTTEEQSNINSYVSGIKVADELKISSIGTPYNLRKTSRSNSYLQLKIEQDLQANILSINLSDEDTQQMYFKYENQQVLYQVPENEEQRMNVENIVALLSTIMGITVN